MKCLAHREEHALLFLCVGLLLEAQKELALCFELRHPLNLSTFRLGIGSHMKNPSSGPFDWLTTHESLNRFALRTSRPQSSEPPLQTPRSQGIMNSEFLIQRGNPQMKKLSIIFGLIMTMYLLISCLTLSAAARAEGIHPTTSTRVVAGRVLVTSWELTAPLRIMIPPWQSGQPMSWPK